jgi:hypothetical protein
LLKGAPSSLSKRVVSASLGLLVALSMAVHVTASQDAQDPVHAIQLPIWLTSPPAWVTWLSFLGGLGAFSWQLYEHLVARKDRRTDRKAAVEAFWYESIVVPRVVEPLLSFLSTHNSAIQSLNGAQQLAGGAKKANTLLADFQKAYADLIPQLQFLRSIDEGACNDLTTLLDTLDDKITLSCFRMTEAIKKGERIEGECESALSHFAEIQRQSIEKLRHLHHKIAGTLTA